MTFLYHPESEKSMFSWDDLAVSSSWYPDSFLPDVSNPQMEDSTYAWDAGTDGSSWASVANLLTVTAAASSPVCL